ncbi:nucleolar protein 6 [Lingula anatina]|uniref:Nucleolar protein 6 n=1 Tax=Lingula anatina TaxID=7574 RepID=A0A1S3JJB4_LINAN|nr:nucleolar protein 6 [Lingula anatina]|eukprot:XP_013410468.1 nucleolar protein 6 [Lingula anatina]
MPLKRALSEKEPQDSEENGSSDESEDEGDAYDISAAMSNIKSKQKNLKKSEQDKIGQNGATAQPPPKMRKVSKEVLYKQPTNKELNELKEAENLFHSSLFRMQITELLKEVMLQEKKKHQVEAYLYSLKDAIMKTPGGKEHDLVNQKWTEKKKIKVPLIQEPFRVKGKFKFIPPKSVKVVGSFLLGVAIKPLVSVDLAVEIPKLCIQPKDYLNHRYLRKRALYLTHLASYLSKQTDIVEDVKFSYHHGNYLKPIIIVSPKGKLSKNVKIHIHATAEDGAFKMNRFDIEKNNVRMQWFNSEKETEGDEESGQPATPRYNMSVLIDLALEKHLHFLHKVIEDSAGVKEGIALLRVWLHQRELDQGQGCFTPFTLSMYVGYLLKKRKLNVAMSSYQIMRNTLLCLAQSDWCKEGISIADVCGVDDPKRPHLANFHESFEVVFVDPTGYINITAEMSRQMFNRVKHEAGLAIQVLENSAVDSFEVLFMTPAPFIRKFDNLFHLTHIENLKKTVASFCLEDQLLDRGGNYVSACLPSLLQLLEKALGKRVELVTQKPAQASQWSISEPPPSWSDQPSLTFGLLFNAESCTTILDKGPAADSPEAKSFREFWGDISELRRFQDGTICEAVVWPSKTLADRRLVCGKIIKHILVRHAEIPRDSMHYTCGQLNSLLCLPQPTNKSTLLYGTGEEQNYNITRSYDHLCKVLRNLQDLPLAIHTIQGTDPVFRYADVFPAMPATFKAATKVVGGRQLPLPDKPCPPWVKSMKVVCLLEASGKWPEDAEAIRRLKAAFHIQLANLLKKQHSMTSYANVDHVDVFKDGFVFRITLGYLKEIAMLKMKKTPEGLVTMRETEESSAMEKELVTLPKFSTAMHGLQQQHHALSSVVRLAKRWVCAQLLGDHIAEEAIELLVAYLYLCPAPFTPPSSVASGLMRFLHLLSNHDWSLSPLIVNLNNELTNLECTEIRTKFTKERSTLPLMFIATPYDKNSSMFTKHKPTVPILQRIVLLARESLAVLQEQLMETHQIVDFKQIFRPPLDAYDVIIQLNTKNLARHYHAVDTTAKTFIPSYKEYSKGGEEETMPVVNFDPVQIYLKELRETFSEFALFFHDSLGGDFIAVLWKPAFFETQPFKLSHINCRAPVTDGENSDVSLKTNVDVILEDFKNIGTGLVRHIEVKKKKH